MPGGGGFPPGAANQIPLFRPFPKGDLNARSYLRVNSKSVINGRGTKKISESIRHAGDEGFREMVFRMNRTPDSFSCSHPPL
jgi:hypothetical protein